MMFKNDSESAYYYDVIEDFNLLLEHYNTRQVLDDLRLLSLTNYEKLVKMVMEHSETKKKTAAIFR